ncbi:MAG: alpha/beta hydrolase-fold protein [Ferruginibacter sp.]
MKKLFALLIICISTPQLYSQNIQHLSVQRLNDSYIDVYIHNKHPEKKMPLLILCQGSGYDSNTEGFLGVAAKFDEQVAGLMIEKQGVQFGDKGDSLSAVYKENNTVYNRLYDYLRVLQYLKKHADWWSGEVYVFGGSEGGLLAGMLASYYPNVKGLAIICYGGGLKFGEAWPIASGLQKKLEGADSIAVAAEELAVKDTLENIRKHATFLESFSGEDNTYAWWASVMNLRISNSLVDLDVPIFVGQGTEDIMAPPASAKKLQQVFQQAGKNNLYLKEYVGYDHSFTDQANKNHLVEVCTDAISWMLKH